jgi:hypothetical protein
MDPKHLNCICCGRQAAYTILIAIGPEADSSTERFYLPNQHVRAAQGAGLDPVEARPFCKPCMRAVEDAFRAAISGLQLSHGISPRELG